MVVIDKKKFVMSLFMCRHFVEVVKCTSCDTVEFRDEKFVDIEACMIG
jgi:hypothetical protein